MNCVVPAFAGAGTKTVLAIGHGFGTAIFNTISVIFGVIGLFILSFGVTAGAIVYLIVKKPKT